MLEDDPYSYYQSDPSPSRMGEVVNFLQPTIDFALNRSGIQDDPVLQAQAKVKAAEAVRKFNPEMGVKLQSYVVTHLQQMSRERRKHFSVAGIPERAQLDLYALERATSRYIEEFDEEPDIPTLADRTGLSPKRIAKIRQKYSMSTPAEGALLSEAGGTPSETYQEALHHMWIGGDAVEKAIIEHRLQYGGNPLMPVGKLSSKLKVSPSYISRKTDDLLTRAQQLEDALTS